MPTLQFESLRKILPAIRDRATALDRAGDWPYQDLRDLSAIGADRWFIPPEFGGEGIDPLELHLRYEAIASASLSTALIVSQRDSAVGLIVGGDNADFRKTALSELATGESFATIGIAQLTTSRQDGPPVLRATPSNDGFLLNGYIPWSTGAAQAKWVIAGAFVDPASENLLAKEARFKDSDSNEPRQILFALPISSPGVTVQPPMPMVALASSWTTRIDCEDVLIDPSLILRGPAAKVLTGRSKNLPNGQAFLALGHCRGAINLIQEHDSDRARSVAEKFSEQWLALRTELLELCQPGREIDAGAAGPSLRGACNDLAIRATHAAVALYKGSALLLDHPAQRLAREAMFLLVWSCPDAVTACTVNVLAGDATS
jgi:alkylation response protein AidB-like acyl-CoA dehydrogenase